MPSRWYFQLGDLELGPVDRAELLEMFSDGRLNGDCHVRQDGSDLRVPLRAVLRADTHSKTAAPNESVLSRAQPVRASAEKESRLEFQAWLSRIGLKRASIALGALVVVVSAVGIWTATGHGQFPEPRMFPTDATIAEEITGFSVLVQVLITCDVLLVVWGLVVLCRRLGAGRSRS